MINLRTVISVLALSVLSACATPEREVVSASSMEIVAARYVSPLPTSITLMTMVKEGNDFGEHSGLLINASEQVLYDPAGSFRHSTSPNARDVNYGMHPAMVQYYKSYHARKGYYVVAQELQVTPEMAELIFQRSIEQGPTQKLNCGISVSSVLNGLSMFEGIPTTYFPGTIMKRFAELPNVITTYVYEDDIGQNLDG